MNPVVPFCAFSGFHAYSASVVGRAHHHVGRSGQDAWAVAHDARVLVAAVADGCSSSRGAELGAHLGARAAVAAALREHERDDDVDTLPRRTMDAVLAEVERAARACTPPRASLARTLDDAFLFTLLVVALAPRGLVVFGAGDGVVGVNGAACVLPSGARNAPDYLAYRLLDDASLAGGRGAVDAAWPAVHARVALDDVESVVIATDGVAPLVDDGTLGALERDERLERNPSLAQKRLFARAQAGAFEPGRALHDDATLVLLRRARPPLAARPERGAPCA